MKRLLSAGTVGLAILSLVLSLASIGWAEPVGDHPRLYCFENEPVIEDAHHLLGVNGNVVAP